MATIGTSSLDVNSLVSQLVSQERATYSAPITAREAKATVQLSAISTLKGAMSSFKTAADTLKTSGTLSPRTTSSSDEDVFTATSASDASTGSYEVNVIDLAKAQQLATKAFTTGSTSAVGNGKLTISYGETSFEVDIASNQGTLAGIRDAINKSTGNTGVQATLLNEQNGTRLVLTSSKTGAENTIKIASSGGDGGLAQLDYSGTDTATISQVSPPKDAHIKIAGFDHYSSTNSVSGAIDGVTLNLKAKSEDPVMLNITEDKTALKKSVTNLVTAYNAMQSNFAKLRSYDPGSKTAGPLLGDALLRGIESQIALDLSNPVAGLAGSYTTLASLGITKQKDGTLAVDDAKLDKALAADSTAVSKVFGGENGVAARLADHLENMLKTGGAIDSRNTSLQTQLKQVEKDNDALDARLKTIETRYRKQFTALDTLLQDLQTKSAYLTAQLGI